MTQSPALRTALATIDTSLPNDFVDYVGRGPNAVPADTLFNALIAIKKLGLDCSYNLFANEYLIGGTVLGSEIAGEVSDAAVLALRQVIRANFGFEPSGRTMQDAVMRACGARRFHPIKDYFRTLSPWDGIERASRLLPIYFNAPDTPFNRAVSRILTMASVRRILKPGVQAVA